MSTYFGTAYKPVSCKEVVLAFDVKLNKNPNMPLWRPVIRHRAQGTLARHIQELGRRWMLLDAKLLEYLQKVDIPTSLHRLWLDVRISWELGKERRRWWKTGLTPNTSKIDRENS